MSPPRKAKRAAPGSGGRKATRVKAEAPEAGIFDLPLPAPEHAPAGSNEMDAGSGHNGHGHRNGADAERGAVEIITLEQFDEPGYLRLNPDVRDAVENGHFASGYAHYLAYGSTEGRPVPGTPREARNVLWSTQVPGAPAQETAGMEARCAIDAVIVAPDAGIMVVGWIDDAGRPLNCVRVLGAGWRIAIDAARFVRVRRPDVEQALGGRGQHAYGIFAFVHFERGGETQGKVTVEFWREGGLWTALECAPTVADDIVLRNTALAHLANLSYFGSSVVEGLRALDQGLGAELVRFNRFITRRIVAAPHVERFGPQGRAVRGTILVCLYGKLEFLFLQHALFSKQAGIEDYEFVYVCNSPELAEMLLRESRSAELIYGLPSSVMILPGNAGFGAANNAAARIARSDRLLAVNPDVFPRDADWARRHTALLDHAPADQTRLFGVPLYYDDGSLMHGGMYFETDPGISLAGGRARAQPLLRTEHYGKGAPPGASPYTRARPVPAVTGAFISVERAWFERLGGFTEDFIFGHYEDADLCLKSLENGTPPWLHEMRLWHLEGKGSTRLPAHEGGSLVNRWLFTRTWLATIEGGLLGPRPAHPMLAAPAAPDASGAERAPAPMPPRKTAPRRKSLR